MAHYSGGPGLGRKKAESSERSPVVYSTSNWIGSLADTQQHWPIKAANHMRASADSDSMQRLQLLPPSRLVQRLPRDLDHPPSRLSHWLGQWLLASARRLNQTFRILAKKPISLGTLGALLSNTTPRGTATISQH